MTLTRRAALLAASALPFAARAADPDAVAPIQGLAQAIAASGRGGAFAQRFNTVAPAVDRAFDLPQILQASVGTRWSALPPDQQAALMDAFRKYTVVQYVANFSRDERIEMLPDSRNVGADQVVSTRIVSGGDNTRVDYLMRRTAGGWRAVDVLLNGSISQVAVNRSDWRSSLTSGAGPLINNLRQKARDLSGGAIS